MAKRISHKNQCHRWKLQFGWHSIFHYFSKMRCAHRMSFTNEQMSTIICTCTMYKWYWTSATMSVLQFSIWMFGTFDGHVFVCHSICVYSVYTTDAAELHIGILFGSKSENNQSYSLVNSCYCCRCSHLRLCRCCCCCWRNKPSKWKNTNT